jgi:lysophospholipase L1-like esterase
MGKFDRKSLIVFTIITAIAIGIALLRTNPNTIQKVTIPTPTPTPEPPFTTYAPPKLEDKHVYKILLVGDSMTHALGPHGGRLIDWLQAKFTGKGFLVDNYAYSTNALTLPSFLNNETKTWDLTFPPILKTEYDVLIIESFGYNPLSDHPLDEGLRIQTDMLTQTVKTLIRDKPHSLVVFMATIAPNKTNFGQRTINLTPEGRAAAAAERVTYIKNHISYAQAHNIPLIDVYEKSLAANGDGSLKYISVDDYIHPSPDGIELICEKITNYLYDSGLVPH